MSHSPLRVVQVNTSAIAHNVAQVKEIAQVDDLMAIVKANGYGHGMVESARAALEGGATWLGVADIDEARTLRAAGISAPILCWIHAPDETFDEAIVENITLGAVSEAQLGAIAQAGARVGLTPKVHLKVDTGLGRNGTAERDWAEVFARASELHAEGFIEVEGVFSHLSNTSEQDDLRQLDVFEQARGVLADAGLNPPLVHLAASLAALTLPETRFNMVRTGIAIYGIGPTEQHRPEEFGLIPAMTYRTQVVSVKSVPANTPVSYGYLYRTSEDTHLALIPVGYGDGINRDASSAGPVLINGIRFEVAGRIAMDQFVVDVGDTPVAVGDEAILFGDPAQGAPSVHDWAGAANSIGYEIVTRLVGTRLTYQYTQDLV